MTLVIVPDYLRIAIMQRIDTEMDRVAVPQEKRESVSQMAYECLLAHFDTHGEIAEFSITKAEQLKP